MKINEAGLSLIKSFEGCRLEAYKCPAGVWTIGFGHTAGVKQGMKITSEEADKLLREDVEKFEKKVDKYNSKYNFNENQFSALVSFAFNVGNIDQLTANGTRSLPVIREKMLLYNKANGKTLTGLVRRRKAEYDLFGTTENVSRETSDGVELMAKEVIDGKWGNGEERYKRIRTAIQTRVNELCRG